MISQSTKPHQPIQIYKLPNGNVDIYLSKEEIQEETEDGSINYICVQKYIRLNRLITENEIRDNLEYWWGYENVDDSKLQNRIEELEKVVDILLGGDSNE